MEEEVSEYGSGCESGWTMYLGPSHEKAASRLTKGGDSQELDEEEEEGFSMVSDASSGPPQVQEDVYCYYNQHIGEKNSCFMSSSSPSFPTAPLQNECSKRRRVETDGPKQQKGPGRCLDDTASSPFIDFSRNPDFNISGDSTRSGCSNLEVSCEFSANYRKSKTRLCRPLPYSGCRGEG